MPEKITHGGKRLGAGVPKNNKNSLLHNRLFGKMLMRVYAQSSDKTKNDIAKILHLYTSK